jgi:hypothetical protein
VIGRFSQCFSGAPSGAPFRMAMSVPHGGRDCQRIDSFIGKD